MVTSPHITDAGLCQLRGFPLRRLDLDGTAVTDEGLKQLAGLPLTALSLNDTHITDRGLANLVGLPLQSLSLRNLKIGDADMPQLAGLPLERLDLAGTFVTPHGTLVLRDPTRPKKIHVSVPVRNPEEQVELRAAGLRIEPARLAGLWD
jgi:hypothetical protein